MRQALGLTILTRMLLVPVVKRVGVEVMIWMRRSGRMRLHELEDSAAALLAGPGDPGLLPSEPVEQRVESPRERPIRPNCQCLASELALGARGEHNEVVELSFKEPALGGRQVPRGHWWKRLGRSGITAGR